MRLKSPGTENTSVTPIWTSRRARWRPSVASEGVTMVEGVELWMVETAPFDGMAQRSVLECEQASSAPILVSMF